VEGGEAPDRLEQADRIAGIQADERLVEHEGQPLAGRPDMAQRSDPFDQRAGRVRQGTLLPGQVGRQERCSLLAAFGLHGIIAYAVRQRRHEIGVRIALGATVGRILAMILGQGARLTAVGIAVGLLGALVLSQFLRTMLFEISPTDPWTLTATVVILIVVVGLATLSATRRATRRSAST